MRKAIRFEEPDQVPIDIGGSVVTGIYIDEYVDLVKHLGLDRELPILYDQFLMLAQIAEPVNRLHSDVISLENPAVAWGIENKDFKPWKTRRGNTALVRGGSTRLPMRMEGSAFWMHRAGGWHTCRKEVCTSTCRAQRPSASRTEDEPGNLGTIASALQRRAPSADGENGQASFYESTQYSIQGGFLKGDLGCNEIFAGHTS